MITTDAQHLGILLLEPAVLTPEGDGLLRSTTGEVKDVKRQNNMLLPPVLAQGHVTFAGRGEGKVRSNFANCCRHMRSFLHEISTPRQHRLDNAAIILYSGCLRYGPCDEK
jgi:hypothetical protein